VKFGRKAKYYVRYGDKIVDVYETLKEAEKDFLA
jgi:hypothetical protein